MICLGKNLHEHDASAEMLHEFLAGILCSSSVVKTNGPFPHFTFVRC